MKLMCDETCATGNSPVRGKGWTLFTSVLLLFMPKCAFCWAAYMSLLSSLGLVIKYQPWFLPVATALFVVTLVKLLIQSMRSKNFLSFGLAIAAGMLILSQRKVASMDAMKVLGILLMTVAVLMDNFLILYRQWVPGAGESRSRAGQRAVSPGFLNSTRYSDK